VSARAGITARSDLLMELHQKEIQPTDLKISGFQGFLPKSRFGGILFGRKQSAE
jgi:hypothetical protein